MSLTPTAFSLAVAGFPTRAVVAIAVLALACLILAYNSIVVRRRNQRVIEQLQRSTLHVAALVDAAPDAIVLVDGAGRVTGANPAAEKLLGRRSEDVEDRPVADVLLPERSRALLEGAPAAWQERHGDSLGRVREIALRRADLGEVPVDMVVALGPAVNGRPGSATVFLRDVTARRRTERLQGLRYTVAGVLAEARSVGEAGDGVLAAVGTRLGCPLALLWSPTLGGLGVERSWADRDGRAADLLRVSRAATLPVGSTLPGRAWSGARTMGVDEAIPHEDAERLQAARAAGLAHGVAVPVAAGGRVLAVLEVFANQAATFDDETMRALDDIGGQLGQLVARRRAETLQDSPERLAAMLESAAEPLIVVAEDGAISGLNDAARRLFGVSTLEVIGDDLRVLVADPYREAVIEYVSEILGVIPGTPPRYLDVEGRHRDGTTFDAGLHITPLSLAGRNAFLCLIDEHRPRAAGTAALRVVPGDATDVQQPRLA